jgi:hypothetical protein
MSSCTFFISKDNEGYLISYRDEGLTKSDLNNAIPEGLSQEDSVEWVNQYFDQWLLNQALREKAKLNLDQASIDEIDNLVESYRIELYTQQYAKLMVQQKLDTVITEKAIEDYYKNQKEDFRLNEELIRALYLHLDERNPDMNKIGKWFRKADSTSLAKLDNYKLSFKGYNLNDSIWLNRKTLLEKITPLNLANEQRYLAPGKTQELQDSTGVYFINTIERLERGDQAPLTFVSPTIKQILLNREKLKYMKRLKTDLLNEIKSNKDVKRYDE